VEIREFASTSITVENYSYQRLEALEIDSLNDAFWSYRCLFPFPAPVLFLFKMSTISFLLLKFLRHHMLYHTVARQRLTDRQSQCDLEVYSSTIIVQCCVSIQLSRCYRVHCCYYYSPVLQTQVRLCILCKYNKYYRTVQQVAISSYIDFPQHFTISSKRGIVKVVIVNEIGLRFVLNIYCVTF
jgi:hypothetical protein